MPQYKYGNMFNQMNGYDLFIVTTNSYIKKDGTLVMGKGSAGQMNELFPNASFILGSMIKELCGHLGEYNLLYFPMKELGFSIGALQVKYHFKENADLLLVQRSLVILKKRAELWKSKRICVNYPSIGFGGLSKDLVEGFVDMLPNNIDVWQHERNV